MRATVAEAITEFCKLGFCGQGGSWQQMGLVSRQRAALSMPGRGLPKLSSSEAEIRNLGAGFPVRWLRNRGDMCAIYADEADAGDLPHFAASKVLPT
jgi:hypothetical protein